VNLGQLHGWFGYFTLLAPIIALAGAATGNRVALRVAPVILDIALLLGLLAMLVGGSRISWVHPAIMLAAVVIGHAVSRRPARAATTGWAIILALLILGVLFARRVLVI
jgi:hypothetical protein